MGQKMGQFIGVDVGKESLVVNGGKEWTVPNTKKGVRSIVETLLKEIPKLVVMESTGGYEELLLNALWKAQIPVSRVNPRRTKAFTHSLALNAKTDAIDARMLRLFAEQIQPAATLPPSKDVAQIKPLIDRRIQLVEMVTQEKNHIKSPLTDDRTKKSMQRIIAALKEELKALDKEILSLIEASTELSEKAVVLQKELGVGPVLTMMLIAEVPELGTISRAKVASLIGVAPLNNQSGTFDGKRSVRGGRKHVRSVLYMATVTAIRCNPRLKLFFLSLVKRGKHKMVALIATMRRFLVVLNTSMRSFIESKQLIRSVA